MWAELGQNERGLLAYDRWECGAQVPGTQEVRSDNDVVMQRDDAGGGNFFARPHWSVEQVMANLPARPRRDQVPAAEVGVQGVPRSSCLNSMRIDCKGWSTRESKNRRTYFG